MMRCDTDTLSEPMIDPADGFEPSSNGHEVLQISVEPPANDAQLILDPRDPLPTARHFRGRHYHHEDVPTLVFNAGDFSNWLNCKWEPTETPELRAKLYKFLETSQKWVTHGKEQSLDPFQPNKSSVDNAIDALKAEAYCKGAAPCWIIDKPNLPDPREIVPARNCLLHLKPDGNPVIVGLPTPAFFSPFALDYDIKQRAPKPEYWLKFLLELWPDDEPSIGLLQEWFGYVLTCDTRQQKFLLLIGPPRSGKGTITRILTSMIGAANVCGPTLSGLATNFGLWALRFKQLAIISDARLRTAASITVWIIAVWRHSSIWTKACRTGCACWL